MADDHFGLEVKLVHRPTDQYDEAAKCLDADINKAVIAFASAQLENLLESYKDLSKTYDDSLVKRRLRRVDLLVSFQSILRGRNDEDMDIT